MCKYFCKHLCKFLEKKIFAQIFAEKFAKKLAQIFYGSYLFAFCNFQQSSAQQLMIEKQATSGEQEHHLCEALLPPRLSNLHHNWGGRLASEHWVVNLLKLLKRFTTSPTPSPSTGASRRECSSTQCLER